MDNSQNMEDASYTPPEKHLKYETKGSLETEVAHEEPNKFGSSKRIIRKIVVLEPSKIKQLGLENKIIEAVSKLNANVVSDNFSDGIHKKDSCWNLIASETIAPRRTQFFCHNRGETQKSVERFNEDMPQRKYETTSNNNMKVALNKDKATNSVHNMRVDIEKRTNILDRQEKMIENKKNTFGVELGQEFSGFTKVEISKEHDILNRLMNAMGNESSSNKIQVVPQIKSFFNYRKCLEGKFVNSSTHKLRTTNSSSYIRNDLKDNEVSENIPKIDDSRIWNESIEKNTALFDEKTTDNFDVLDKPLETCVQSHLRQRNEGENFNVPQVISSSQKSQTSEMQQSSKKGVIILEQKILKSGSPIVSQPQTASASRSFDFFRDNLQINVADDCSAAIEPSEERGRMFVSQGLTKNVSKKGLNVEINEPLLELRSSKESSDVIKNICKTFMKRMVKPPNSAITTSNECRSEIPGFGDSNLATDNSHKMVSGRPLAASKSSGHELLTNKIFEGNVVANSSLCQQEQVNGKLSLAYQKNNTKTLNYNVNKSPLPKSNILSSKNIANINSECIKIEPLDAVEYILNCTQNHNISSSGILKDEREESYEEIDWHEEEMSNNEIISPTKETFLVGNVHESKVFNNPAVICEQNNILIIKPTQTIKNTAEQPDVKMTQQSLCSPSLNATSLTNDKKHLNNLQALPKEKSIPSENMLPLHNTLSSNVAETNTLILPLTKKIVEKNTTRYLQPTKRKCTILNYSKVSTTPINDISERIKRRMQSRTAYGTHDGKHTYQSQNEESMETVSTVELHEDSQSQTQCNIEFRKEESLTPTTMPKLLKLEPCEERLVDRQSNKIGNFQGHVKACNGQSNMKKIATSELSADNENNCNMETNLTGVRNFESIDKNPIFSEPETVKNEENNLQIDCIDPAITPSKFIKLESCEEHVVDRQSNKIGALQGHVKIINVQTNMKKSTAVELSTDDEINCNIEKPLTNVCKFQINDKNSILSESGTMKNDKNNLQINSINRAIAPSAVDDSKTNASNYVSNDNLENDHCLGDASISSQWHTNENCNSNSSDTPNLTRKDQKSNSKRRKVNHADHSPSINFGEIMQSQISYSKTSGTKSGKEILLCSNVISQSNENKKPKESNKAPEVDDSITFNKNIEIAVPCIKNSSKSSTCKTDSEKKCDGVPRPTRKEIIPIKKRFKPNTTSSSSPNRRRCSDTKNESNCSINVENPKGEYIPARSKVVHQFEERVNQDKAGSDGKFIHNEIQKNKGVINDYCINSKILLVNSREEFRDAMELVDNDVGNDEEVDKSKSAVNTGSYRCGACKHVVCEKLFNEHLMDHYGVGWRDGLDKPINITSYREVLNTMCNYMKRNKVSLFTCKICGEKKKSAAGFLVHIQTCLLDNEQLNAVMQACEFCSKRFLPPALWTHNKTCTSTPKHADNPFKTSQISPQLDGVSSKRKAAIKAANIFKTIIEAPPTIEDFINEYHAPRGPGLVVKWKNDIKKHGAAKCFEKSCSFETDDIITMKTHAKNCLNIRRGGFNCIRCMFYDVDKDKVRNHVLEKHEKALNTVENETREESNDLSVMGNYFDSTEESSNDDELEITVKRPVSCPRVNEVNPYDATQHIYDEIHSKDVLYATLKPTTPLKESSLINFKPTIKRSIRFGFTMDKFVNKFVGATEPPLKWTQLGQGEVKIFNGEAFVFIGGPVTNCAWAPTPSLAAKEVEYLAVTFKNGFNSRTKFLDPIVEDTLILVYKVDLLGPKKLSIETKLLYGFQSVGPVHHIEFMPSGGFAPNINRLGLLAVASVRPNVNIFALPLVASENNRYEVKSERGEFFIVDLKPSLVLCVDLCHESKDIDNFTAQCLRVSWSEIKEHNIIAAGFSNGCAGIWDIRNEDNLSKFHKDGVPHYVPLSYFNAIPHAISGIALHYTAKDTRWIVVTNIMREFRIYDLEDIRNPLPLVKDGFQKSSISSTIWPIYSENPAFAINDDFTEEACSVFTRSTMNVNYKTKSHIKCPSGVNTLCFTPWKNALIAGCENGDIILQRLKTLSAETSTANTSPRMYIFFTDVVKLDGQPIPRVKATPQKEILDSETIQSLDLFQEKYNESYGLIFGGPVTANRSNRNLVVSTDRVTPFSLRALTRVNCVSLCSVIPQRDVAAIGYNNGMIRIKPLNYCDFS